MIDAAIFHAAAEGDTFDPVLWLSALASIGGGYALTADRRLCLIVADCQQEDLAPLMAQLAGQPDRLEAVCAAIELRREGSG